MAEQSVAQAFVFARRDARGLAHYPGSPPTDLATAYRIQDFALSLDGRRVAGWKVGKINPPHDSTLGVNRLAGPIFADEIVDALDGGEPAMPIFAQGFAAAEAEFLLHVASGWDGTQPMDDAATRALIDDARIGIEIASSPYPGINDDGPPVTASDFGNNAGLVLGRPIAAWHHVDMAAIPVATVIDGETIGEATAATMLDGPYGAVRFLLAHLAERGIAADGGFWVSSGAVTGVHPVKIGQRVTARFGTHGDVSCTITEAKAR